jgi:hypothetical protein
MCDEGWDFIEFESQSASLKHVCAKAGYPNTHLEHLKRVCNAGYPNTQLEHTLGCRACEPHVKQEDKLVSCLNTTS